MITATQFSEPLSYHGEGAVWSEVWGGLRCVDMFRGDILCFAPDGSASRRNVGTLAAMIRPAGAGMSIVAGERELLLWHESTDAVEPFTAPLVEKGCRLNEGGCAPDGTLLIGSLGPDAAEGAGQLLRVSGDGSHTVVLPTVTVSNGIGFSPDGTRAYYADSPTGRVDVFTVTDTHELIERRPFVTIAEEDGAPDGLWIDADGSIWVALYGGSRVQRYLPSGLADETVHIPARQVTSCTFGGPGLETLYVTTSRENLAEDDDPLAGSIFSAAIGIKGMPVTEFKLKHTA